MFLLCNYSTLLTLGKIILHIALQVNNSEAVRLVLYVVALWIATMAHFMGRK